MPKLKVQIMIEQKDYDQLSKLAKKGNSTENRIARNLLLMGIDDCLQLDKLGVFDIVIKSGEIMNKLKSTFLMGKKEISIEDLKK